MSRQWTVFFLLQNADELRATGGFLGSLARLDWRAGQSPELTFFDVYDLDAQIPEFPTAPVGVQTYLTAGRDELHLQDANWERDFPTSARQISDLLVAAGQPQPDAVVAVNSTLIEQLLTYLSARVSFADAHGQTLMADNFSTLARADHELFAANRQPKTRFLRSLGWDLWTYFRQSSLSAKWQLLQFIYQARHQRLWQAFSRHCWAQLGLRAIGATGALRPSPTCQQIYFVASNVGINKSNHATTLTFSPPVVTRLDWRHSQAEFTLDIANDNPLDPEALITRRLHFADYQRLLLPPGVTVVNLEWQGQPLDSWDERLVRDSRGRQWRELGFLLVVNEQDRGQLHLTLRGAGQCWRVSD